MESFSVEDVCSHLASKGISQEVIANFEQHGITGEVFLCLNQDPEYIKELAPRIADRVILKKVVDKNSNEGSWKEKLRNRFKFIRRPSTKLTSEDSEGASSDSPPQPKRRRTKKSARLGSESSGPLSDDEATYHTSVKELQLECKKKKRDRSVAMMLDMTKATFKWRRQWIISETPSVNDILTMFPSLKHRKIFRAEFKAVLRMAEDENLLSLLDTWPLWQKRIVASSEMEKKNRPKVNELLRTLAENDEDTELKCIICFQLLSELLIYKNKERLVHHATDSDNLYEIGRSVGMNAPFLVVCRSSEVTTYHIVVEQQPSTEASSFGSAILDLFSSYFVYDIAYPKPFYSLLIFIQHHILGLSDDAIDPAAVIEIATSLKNMDSTF